MGSHGSHAQAPAGENRLGMGKNQLSEGGKVIVGLERVFVILARDTKVRSHIMRFISEENGGARGPGSIVDTSESVQKQVKTVKNGVRWES